MITDSTKVFRAVLIILYILVFGMTAQNLRYQDMHYDEAVQFWISKGLNPDTAPFSPEGDVRDVIENNRYYNLDPGGFSIMLHYWSMISNHVIMLRLLPFLFFTAAVGGFIFLARKWSGSIDIALLAGFIPLLIPLVSDMSIELRAYSMEILGIVSALMVLQHLQRRISFPSLIAGSAAISFFMFSRYSYVIVAFVASLYVCWLILNHPGKWARKMAYLAVYAIPVLATLTGIYFLSMVHQNPGAEPVSYITYLKFSPFAILEPLNIAFMTGLTAAAALLYHSFSYENLKKYSPLLYLFVSASLVFLILSFLGKHPWDLTFKQNISVVVLLLLCMAALAGELLKPLLESQGITKYYLITGFLLLIIIHQQDSILSRYSVKENTFFTLLDNDVSRYEKIYVDLGHAGYVKYYFEYGPQRNQHPFYPENFTLQISHRYNRKNREPGLRSPEAPDMKMILSHDLILFNDLYAQAPKEYGNWVLLPRSETFWIKRTAE